MIKIFQFLWHGCWHKWEYQQDRIWEYPGLARFPQAVYKCSKCDKLKAKRY
jgi:hypothetical protein